MRKKPDNSDEAEKAIGWIPPNVLEKFTAASGVTVINNNNRVHQSGPKIEADIDIDDNESIISKKQLNPLTKIRMSKK